MESSKGEDACSLNGAANGEAVALHQDGEGTAQTSAGKEELHLPGNHSHQIDSFLSVEYN